MAQMIDLNFDPDEKTLRQFGFVAFVGLGTIAVAVNEEDHTIEEVHEPFLIQEGYLRRSPQGRVLTEKGWKVSGVTPPDGTGQLNLI